MVDIIEVLKVVNGTNFIGMDTRTVLAGVRGGKANPMVGKVTKIMTGANVMLLSNKVVNGYDAMVRRRLEAEGKDPASFTLSPRKWGERIAGLPLVYHKKDGGVSWYLEAIFVRAGSVSYEYDGKPIAKEDIVGFPPQPAEGEQAGLDNKVILRTFGMDSLTRLRVNHRQFVAPFEVKL